MKPLDYLNAVLSVIAFCLVVITFSILGLIPTVSAKGLPQKFVTVPLNSDGSLNVKIVNNTVDVNIDEVRGMPLTGAIDVNIDEVGGNNTNGTLPVEIDK
jgi:hypothetical protein